MLAFDLFPSLSLKIIIKLKPMSLFAMGANSFGQLALGDDVDMIYEPEEVPCFKDMRVNKIATGKIHGLALVDGSVYSWGINDDCALGRETNEINKETEPMKVQFEEKFREKVVDICGGASYSCLLTAKGNVYTCGTFKNGSGIFGYDASTKFQAKFKKIRNLKRIKSIHGGQNHILMVDRANHVWSMGTNDFRQLGVTFRERRRKRCLEPSLVCYRTKENVFVKAAAGGFHSILVNNKKEAYAFGGNFNGQLGLGGISETEPMAKINLSGVVDAKCGYTHTLFLTENKEVYGCGDNSCGQLGIEEGRLFDSPVLIMKNVDEIFVGQEASFCRVGNAIYSFGSNLSGEAGAPFDITKINKPRQILEGIDVECIGAGCDFTLIMGQRR